jgi:hypothetical protein
MRSEKFAGAAEEKASSLFLEHFLKGPLSPWMCS